MSDATSATAGSIRQSVIERMVGKFVGPSARHGRVTNRLDMENVTKRYGETIALENASVAFRPGIHTILGENGSGKSTMLKLLSGVVAPSEGRILLNGNPVSPRNPRDMQDLGLSTVFQEVLIAPHRSVVENIFLGYDQPFRRRISKADRAKLAGELLGSISRFPVPLDVPAGELPLATQQLVVLARAFVRLPSILLLDEATAALDYADRDMVFEIVEDYAAAGNIVIFISHRLEEVKRLSHKVTVLRSGRIVETLEEGDISSEKLLKLMAPEVAAHVR
ncbi:ATP-binding cassette domain-containing protein [Martelella sp.]|mgnify:CR=1 FL=1|uniref:ATP-binding cassette domain-containing protein n=1 Tax=Martelella sp. TaxID=1969699 RepID=UPI0025BAB391|nr:ATP-binding cassette domain-containing protein [Martelella sp.]